MSGEAAGYYGLYRQTRAVHGDTFAQLKLGEGAFDGKLETV
jgi:hypothetical protein